MSRNVFGFCMLVLLHCHLCRTSITSHLVRLKMEPDKESIRRCLLFCFLQKKSASDSHKIICQSFGNNIISVRTCVNWFQRFKNGDFDISDKERSGRPTVVQEKELQALLNEDSTQSTRELALQLGVDHSTIVRRLKAMGRNYRHNREELIKKEISEDYQPPAIPNNTHVTEELNIDSYEYSSISYGDTSYGDTSYSYPDSFEKKMEATNAENLSTINQDKNFNSVERSFLTHPNDAYTEKKNCNINKNSSIILNKIPKKRLNTDNILIKRIMQPNNFNESSSQKFLFNTTNGKTDKSDTITYSLRLTDSSKSSDEIQTQTNFPSTSNPNVLVPIISKQPTTLIATNKILRKVICKKRSSMTNGENKYPELVEYAAKMLAYSKDDNGTFGAYVSSQLRRISSNIIRTRTERLIQNILFDVIEEDPMEKFAV